MSEKDDIVVRFFLDLINKGNATSASVRKIIMSIGLERGVEFKALNLMLVQGRVNVTEAVVKDYDFLIRANANADAMVWQYTPEKPDPDHFIEGRLQTLERMLRIMLQ